MSTRTTGTICPFVTRALTTRWSLGVDYWFDAGTTSKISRSAATSTRGMAFPMLEPGQPGAVNTVLLNYLYRPYRGHTGIVRAIYSF